MAKMTTRSDLIEVLDTFYSTKMLFKVRNNLVTRQTAEVIPIPKKNSKTLERRKAGDFTLSTTPLQEGVTPEAQVYNDSYISMSVNQYGDFTYITDEVEMTVHDDRFAEIQEELQWNAKDSREYLNLDTLVATSNLYGVDSTSDDDGILDTYSVGSVDGFATTDSFDSVLQTLLSNTSSQQLFRNIIMPNRNVGTVGIQPGFIVFFPGAAEIALKNFLKDNGQLRTEYPNPNAALPGEMGSYYKLRFVRADMLDERGSIGTGANGNPVYPFIGVAKHAWMISGIGNNDIKVISKPFGHGEDRLDQRRSTGYKFWHGAKILDDSFMFRLDMEIA